MFHPVAAFIFCSLVLMSQGEPNSCVESNAKSCKTCISIPGCAWCEYPAYADNPNVFISRCDERSNLESGNCPADYIKDPLSWQNATKNANHSNVGEQGVGKATQIRPQLIDGYIRPGDPLNVRLSFKQAEDYPVDLYYLLDLSKSMENDLQSLRDLGQKLGDSMKNITRDFRLGFGSFIDKTVMPFISTVPSKVKNPCSDQAPCVPTYSFHNDLPLTSHINAFVNSVKNVTHSSNLDNPEGGLDAMMQAIVCKNEINWRDDATHLLVFSTDAGFHYAGDGKLGGIVRPNDGMCYLDNAGRYTMANQMDYPSIGHLVKKISEYNIQPIFAVTQNVVETYENLQRMIPKSFVGNLTSDSSNIIGLIQNAYNDLKGQVILEVTAPQEVTVSNFTAHCSTGTVDGLECDGLKLGDVVNFTLSISTDTCLSKPVTVKVSPYGYNEEVIIQLQPLCDCECEINKAPNNCSGHGQYQCGACVCEPDFTGLDCSCNQQDVSSIESYLVNCTDSNTGVVCNDRGLCQCGKCLCRQQPGHKIDGKFCECDNTTCPRNLGKVCNNLGECDCGTCRCKEGWEGSKCECPLDQAPCFDPSNQDNSTGACNGNGVCKCGKCDCKTSVTGAKFRGIFCETNPGGACNLHRDCVQCKAFATGTYNTTDLCDTNCVKYNVTTLDNNEGSAYLQECRVTDLSDDCAFNFYYAEVGDDNVIMVDVDPNKICKVITNPIYIIIGIIAAIVGIGLAILLIWKLLTSIKDAREYRNFQKEAQDPKWEGGENPIFKKATSTFRNPMYTGGKPKAN